MNQFLVACFVHVGISLADVSGITPKAPVLIITIPKIMI